MGFVRDDESVTENAEMWLKPTTREMVQMPRTDKGDIWMFDVQDAWEAAGLLPLGLSPKLV